jgi:hypothetical protein
MAVAARLAMSHASSHLQRIVLRLHHDCTTKVRKTSPGDHSSVIWRLKRIKRNHVRNRQEPASIYVRANYIKADA